MIIHEHCSNNSPNHPVIELYWSAFVIDVKDNLTEDIDVFIMHDRAKLKLDNSVLTRLKTGCYDTRYKLYIYIYM